MDGENKNDRSNGWSRKKRISVNRTSFIPFPRLSRASYDTQILLDMSEVTDQSQENSGMTPRLHATSPSDEDNPGEHFLHPPILSRSVVQGIASDLTVKSGVFGARCLRRPSSEIPQIRFRFSLNTIIGRYSSLRSTLLHLRRFWSLLPPWRRIKIKTEIPSNDEAFTIHSPCIYPGPVLGVIEWFTPLHHDTFMRLGLRPYDRWWVVPVNSQYIHQ